MNKLDLVALTQDEPAMNDGDRCAVLDKLVEKELEEEIEDRVDGLKDFECNALFDKIIQVKRPYQQDLGTYVPIRYRYRSR